MKGGQKKKIAGYVRFALDAEERDLLRRACALDERSMADFARIYSLRAATVVLGQGNGKNANEFIAEAKKALNDMFRSFEDESKRDKKQK